VFQEQRLFPFLTAVDDVAFGLRMRGVGRRERLGRAAAMLERVGLGHRGAHKPAELSGGERQRAAIARALVTRPACVLADEPTGNLDRHTAESVFELMLALNAEIGTSIVIVTHDPVLAARTSQTWRLEEGRLVEVDAS
jgi:lipoprotein-releasing system ATP-binding protein